MHADELAYICQTLCTGGMLALMGYQTARMSVHESHCPCELDGFVLHMHIIERVMDCDSEVMSSCIPVHA